ncbi:DUF1338 domain-containing protein [Allofrancisella guangzhouensis]|uniref:2-oxoadipate dioxygenase/decarboxylase n=1 Tax=Allofrancisella guangzhouensis TaxID=594679 RepID=A0A0A8E4P6_9GAMM|nr:DUF1338 domain-containing protein [Allofrancisella guangzhouensis]AJC48939.1 succinyldiaminopimelate aminotransferase [Allofrancisella guangzhouensis]MBK2027095.1 DUF1338 domain-containing protein [Allofrancisella guangzhouensis]MBK2043731.1 DUF1338 domain-containing protein [Allofrancisella guangzhouensis]MBK2045667.1 DUF1338 domain-containing protein [Allofrancisella guangzhouensis]
MNIDILNKLWEQYVAFNPHVTQIYDLFVKEGENPINDHIALRTLDDPSIDINILAGVFISNGYSICGNYEFDVKKLKAIHLEHTDENQPKVFISQLLTKEFSSFVQETMKKCVKAIPQKLLDNKEQLLVSGTSWGDLSYQTYTKLLEESEYAAWFYAFGFRVNHFTVLINALKNFDEVAQVNEFLKRNGIKLNSSGGEIKGSPADLLEQSSTMSGLIEVDFIEGKKTIPCCYYEFAKRYLDKNGKLYQGFVAKSADKIFESTNFKS